MEHIAIESLDQNLFNMNDDETVSSSCRREQKISTMEPLKKRFSWSEVTTSGDPPGQRSLHVGVVLNSSMFIFGGYDGIHRVNDLFEYSFLTGQWQKITCSPAGPVARDRHVAVPYENSLYVFGGYDGSNRVNDLWCFDASTFQWQEIDSKGAIPSARHSHCAVIHKHKLYVFGGYDGNYRDDFYEFCLNSEQWVIVQTKNPCPKARYRTSAVVHNNWIYIFGGHDGTKHLNDLHRYDIHTRMWEEITTARGQVPSPRDSHVAVMHQDSMYVFGGSSGTAQNDMYSFYINTYEWTRVKGNYKAVRRSISTASNTSYDMESVSVSESHQQVAGMYPCPRFCHSAVVFNGTMFVFGGYDGTRRLCDFIHLKLANDSTIEIPPSTLAADLKQFVNDSMFSDIEILLDDNSVVYAHKILLARCPYFKALLTGPMIESKQNQVAISNVSRSIFLALLDYIYCEDISILYGDTHSPSIEVAMDLFVAADLFGVERLKKLCEECILQAVDNPSAPSIILAADLHNATTLRQFAMDFILKNFDVVTKTPEFEELCRKNIDIIVEILKKR
eukprot:Platyproteum_vivax@DN5889_c0_g1_i1.p1